MNPQMNTNQNPQVNPGMMNNQQMVRRSRMPWAIITIVVVIILAVLAFLFRDKLGMGASKENVSDYQAVFLTNGQVYFGKLSDVNSTYVTLKDIYYLQVNQQLQPGADGTTPTQTTNNQQPQISLVKLGNELHGPVDEMKINREQVLFFEDLKSDGRVSQAIADYQKNGATAPQQQQTQQQTQQQNTQQQQQQSTTPPTTGN